MLRLSTEKLYKFIFRRGASSMPQPVVTSLNLWFGKQYEKKGFNRCTFSIAKVSFQISGGKRWGAVVTGARLYLDRGGRVKGREGIKALLLHRNCMNP